MALPPVVGYLLGGRGTRLALPQGQLAQRAGGYVRPASPVRCSAAGQDRKAWLRTEISFVRAATARWRPRGHRHRHDLPRCRRRWWLSLHMFAFLCPLKHSDLLGLCPPPPLRSSAAV